MMSRILAQASSESLWMPPRASTVAGEVDGLFTFITIVTAFFVALILALMIGLVWKYRYRPERPAPEKSASHNTALELTWTVIPVVIVVVIFFYGFRGYLNMSVAPANAYEIQVNGKMWSWDFIYPNGHVSSELHVPVNTPVRLILSSSDVIHSLYVPQFRLKKDAVPGRYNRFWLQATQTGEFDVYCAEYCGTSHSEMLTKVVVHPAAAFNEWLERESNWENRMTPREAGEMLVRQRGCLTCHSLDGTANIGPTFKDMFGKTETLTTGESVLVDENYVRESIYEPNAKIVQGYPPQMPSYKGLLKDRDVDAIITYFKDLSAHAGQLAAPAETAPPSPGTPGEGRGEGTSP